MKNVLHFFNVSMVVVYLFCAVILLFNNSILDWLPSNNRIILALVIIAYAAFKIYRIMKDKKLKESSDETQ